MNAHQISMDWGDDGSCCGLEAADTPLEQLEDGRQLHTAPADVGQEGPSSLSAAE